ncbi:MAG: hypothetical protein PHS93_10230 [Candidatus Omnitrophica bacterium]|jgi:hypothetical protein|nr:hypothetical protein [Candidatus Omnitrophota bacterium]MDD5353527.1 hypothetical protein [Candidatus Omnitrophota bacterium]
MSRQQVVAARSILNPNSPTIQEEVEDDWEQFKKNLKNKDLAEALVRVQEINSILVSIIHTIKLYQSYKEELNEK